MAIKMKMHTDGSISMSGSIELTQRSNFAVQHLMAAARFARQSKQVEVNHADEPFGEFYSEIIANTTASILLSVACLEAYINELFADSAPLFNEIDKILIEEIWELIESQPILEKYQLALIIKGKARMQKGEQPYQDADILIKVRNALVHFKPEWHHEQKVHRKIGQMLEGKFPMSPFLTESSPVFPPRSMTYGLAKWAVESVIHFINHFSIETGLPNRLVDHLDKMQIE